ncbi:hypothetical protein Dsin_012848 [Dipteronia sinensis]|uniref:Reverse transcriptase n=1 Tax=Dipteronia sinensis TaxID=43782 RepID=A0AAE0AIU1_9ROSI|nr:hypothetical protein Dsin_012848 [Dipteronia sinensis]
MLEGILNISLASSGKKESCTSLSFQQPEAVFKAATFVPGCVVSSSGFESVLRNSEKNGGSERSNVQVERFREALDDCGLEDLSFVGPRFTWSNKRSGDRHIQERLNCGVCCDQWKLMFPMSEVQHLDFWGSNHRPILVWLVKSMGAWRSYLHGISVVDLNLRKEIVACKRSLSITSNEIRPGSWAGVRKIENRLDSTLPSKSQISKVTDTVNKKLSEGSRRLLDRDFTADEIRIAIFDMAPTKAPGIDGLYVLFYHNFWEIVEKDVTAACLRCLNNGDPLDVINRTLITLIPKVQQEERISDFRRISLCNVTK